MLSNIQIGMILLLLAGYPTVYFKGRWDGSEACDTRHAEVQAKQTKSVKVTHAKVKREAPGDANKPAAIEWLRQHVRQ